MPPRQPRRPPARFSIGEPDTPANPNRLAFQKPNLPPLQGTPSSRRQYSYGAEVEPMSSHPGHGLSRQHGRDIDAAVQDVLKTPKAEDDGGGQEEEYEEMQKSRKQAQRNRNGRSELDELAGGQQPQSQHAPSYLSRPLNSGPVVRLTSMKIPRQEGSDGDDARSFGIESDFYGDATISSTPGVLLPQQSRSRQIPSVESISTNESLRRSARNKRPAPIGEDTVDLVRQPQNRQKSPVKAKVSFSPLQAPPRRPPKQVVPSRPETVEEEDEEEDEDEVEDADATEEEREDSEEDELLKAPEPKRIAMTNTPAPKRSHPVPQAVLHRTRVGGPAPPLESGTKLQRPNSNRDITGRTGSVGAKTISRAPRTTESPNRRLSSRQARQEPESVDESSEDGRWLNRAVATTNFPSLFAQAKFLVSSPFTVRPRYPSDESERDAAIQRDIAAAEAEVARERRQEEAEASRRPSQHRWLWLKSFVPFTGRPHAEFDSMPDENNHRRSVNLLRFLNPMTYARATAWLIQAMLDWIMKLVHFIIPTGLWDRLSSVFGFLPHILAGALAFVVAFALATQLTGSIDPDWAPNAIGATLRTLEDMRYTISDLVPTVSWPRRERWIDIDDLWEDDDSSRDKLQQFLHRMEEEFLSLKRSGKIHDASLEKLEHILPSIVHMELKDGKPVISEEFWHALRNLIHGDGGFFAFDKVGPEYVVSSERQWDAITSRLIQDTKFTRKLNLTLSGLEDRLSNKMATFWDKWVKDNDEKIAQLLGPALDQIKSAGSQKEFEERLSKIVNEQLSLREDGTEKQRGKILSRNEFIQHMKDEFASLSAQLKVELKDLQPQMERMVQQAVQLATKDLVNGLSKADVATLVNGLIHKALADINLEAMARGKIHNHWDTELRNQVNYFAPGSGATVDARLTSPTWNPRGRRGPETFPPKAALESWQDEGDCWCAARSVNHRGNPHGATLSVHLNHDIIPQHIVIEHILPGATTQPGARPKSIEVWAEILNPEIRERVLDFGSVYFPDDEQDWNFTPPDFPSQFVKMAQFVYEDVEIHGGVHVHKLSSELLALGAQTDRVVVRAVSNYGAESHTCFYRVRLYGFNVEMDSEEQKAYY